jgi:hypothetical protein
MEPADDPNAFELLTVVIESPNLAQKNQNQTF